MKTFFKNQDGATAVEFALLAVPYVFLTVGIIELAIMYAAASLLEGATNSAARLIRTGQIQQAGPTVDPEGMFRDALCDYATALVDCDDVVIQVTPVSSFSDVAGMQPTFDADGNMESDGFDAGGSNDRILIRASYKYHLMTPFIGPLLGGPDSAITFLSTIVLQTEPYDFDGS